jgi:hypothetical protein
MSTIKPIINKDHAIFIVTVQWGDREKGLKHSCKTRRMRFDKEKTSRLR